MTQKQVTDDLFSLLNVLPPEIASVIMEIGRNDDLIEVILDLGRVPTARYTDGEKVLAEQDVTQDDIDSVVTQIGEFDADNRAGIDGTLHRISAIRNRKGDVVGLTCRMGRAVFGTIDIVEDIISSGKSVLFLGRPGVGKTTMLREAARVLAESNRVVVVDTSNEIGGDGDIPHPAVGRARRMQVPTPSLQHEIMIEAVENHNPEVIVIDEIGRELEALAARTINERGVQLIGTAHGITIDNLLMNPTLSDLVGGIESVTLSDEEARRRGTQKTVLERRQAPTFDVLIEIAARDTLYVHPDVGVAVDSLLRGLEPPIEIRKRGTDGEVVIETPPPVPVFGKAGKKGRQQQQQPQQAAGFRPNRTRETDRVTNGGARQPAASATPSTPAPVQRRQVSIFPYGIARNRLMEASSQYKVPINIVDELDQADVLLTLKNFYRRRPRVISDAEQRGLPIYVLRSNTINQIEDFIADYFDMESDDQNSPLQEALREAQEAIRDILLGQVEAVNLSPQKAGIRRHQHEMIRQANLGSSSYGKEPHRHVRVFRE
ncbi:MAG TPA: R3H domain-containing nucleic acid-binding protein [Aggregatilineales bacterium]|nr:R3H domain-containing nucleic acid-binding protein [Aggregatilineales bacterium]